jgi:DNA-binding HxlR family transcriptional regulator
MRVMEQRSACPINYSLEIFGDKWTFLILRDIMFNEKYSFLEFRASEEKISSAVLTEKLNLLIREGIVFKKTSPQNASKFLYLLTDKGIDLAPIIIDFLEWGSRYSSYDGPLIWLERIKRNKKKAIADLQVKLRNERETR